MRAGNMVIGCEVCSSLSQVTGALVTSRRRAVYRVIAPERVLSLCEEHAFEVENCRAESLEELRGRFLEPFPGQRSLIPRRTRLPLPAVDQAPRERGRRTND